MTFLIVIHIVICIFLVGVILLQPGKSDGGIGFGSSSQSIFGSKTAGNFLTKTTSICALVFLATSFILTRARIKEYTGSVIGSNPPAATAPATDKGQAPAADKAGEAAKGSASPQDAKAPAASGDAAKATNSNAGKAAEPTKKQ